MRNSRPCEGHSAEEPTLGYGCLVLRMAGVSCATCCVAGQATLLNTPGRGLSRSRRRRVVVGVSWRWTQHRPESDPKMKGVPVFESTGVAWLMRRMVSVSAAVSGYWKDTASSRGIVQSAVLGVSSIASQAALVAAARRVTAR